MFRYPFRIPRPGPATPTRKRVGLDCSAFVRHYLRNHYCFLFLRVLRCFTSPGIALKPYFIQTPVTSHYRRWVAPFGNPRVRVCLPLPEAYRSLPRPSSPSDAKASIVCPYALDQNSWSSRIKLPCVLYAIVKDQINFRSEISHFRLKYSNLKSKT